MINKTQGINGPDTWVVDLIHTETSLGVCKRYTPKRTAKELPSRVGCSADKGACGHTKGNIKNTMEELRRTRTNLPFGSVTIEAGLGGAVAPALPVVDVEREFISGGGLCLKVGYGLELGVHVGGDG